LRLLVLAYRVAYDAFLTFLRDDGWAIASHIALSTLMSLFPFLIFLTALTSFLYGSEELAEKAAEILLEAWPEEVAGPIAGEISSVLTNAHGGVLTFGAVLALYFSTSGVESLRIGLNRAYGVTEMRHWLLLRLESIAYVLIAAVGLLALAFLIVLGPLISATAIKYAPWLVSLEGYFNLARFAIVSIVLIVALVIAHKWLPPGRRRLSQIWAGILVTLVLWLVICVAFGRYLSEFAYTYVTYYAGLASVMIALVFLYWIACIFVYGGELNAAISRFQDDRPAKF